MGVAEAAIAALEQAHALAGLGEIGDEGLAILLIDLCARRHLHDGIVAACARHHLAEAALPVLGLDMLLEAVIDEGVEIIDRLGPDIAAAPAIAAIGPAIFDEFLAAERDAAIAARAAGRINLGDIEKAHGKAPSGGSFREERLARQQHVMTEHPAFARSRRYQAAAAMAPAQLGKDMAGGRIVREPACRHAFQPQPVEGMGEEPRRRLGGEAFTQKGRPSQ